MVIGFDFDGTLVRGWTAEPLPGVREKLASLPADARTFIATNQAGPVFRAVTGDSKYPTVADVAARIVGGLAALEWRPQLLLIATYPGRNEEAWTLAAERTAAQLQQELRPCMVEPMPAWRKPRPGMLAYAVSHFKTRPAFTIYVGDMVTDQDAAHSASSTFQWAAEFFAR